MSVFQIDPVTKSFARSGGSFVRISGREEIRQGVDVRFRLFRGEAELDTSLGFPYFEDVLGSDHDEAVITAAATDLILGSKGITALDSLLLDYEPGDRGLAIAYEATGTLGELAEDLKIKSTVEVPI